jgi:hypothetical protein
MKIESLIQQERALFLIDADHNHIRTEHKELVDKLTHLQTERGTRMEELAKQDTRIARTLELEGIWKRRIRRLISLMEIYSAD